MNALPIEHMNAYSNGPMSWITKGAVDLDMLFLFPSSESEDVLDAILDEIDGLGDRTLVKFENVIASHSIPILSEASKRLRLKHIRRYGTQNQHAHETTPGEASELLIFSKIQFNDLKASVPLSVPHLSYMTNALIRPVVAFINNNKTRIPISFSAKMNIVNII